MQRTLPEMVLFVVFACCVAVLVITFPAVWRWRNTEAKKLEEQLEEAQREPNKADGSDRWIERNA